MRPSKILLVILDGLGDTTSFIDNKCGTSLEFAEHPVLNACVKRGMTGLMDSVAPGFPCGSDTAHLSLFGYSPFKVYNGRGAFEAIGSGMQLEQDNSLVCSNPFPLNPLQHEVRHTLGE